jgi:hypothetical protein
VIQERILALLDEFHFIKNTNGLRKMHNVIKESSISNIENDFERDQKLDDCYINHSQDLPTVNELVTLSQDYQ